MTEKTNKIKERIENVLFIMVMIYIGGAIVFSLLATTFKLFFRDGHGISPYGNRGNDYMYDDY